MSKVRCAGCERYRDKALMVPYGLGYACDGDCRILASENRRRAAKAPRDGGPSKAMRDRVRNRDGNRCRFCGSPNNLAIHHVEYRSEGGHHDEYNLITLCLEHHELMHSNKGRWQPVCLGVLVAYYEEDQFMTIPQYVTATTGRIP